MKYESLCDLLNDNENLKTGCDIEYLVKYKDQLLDSDYGKDNNDKFKKINAIRNILYEMIIEYRTDLDEVYKILVYNHDEYKRDIEPISKHEYIDRTYYTIRYIEHRFLNLKSRLKGLYSILEKDLNCFENPSWYNRLVEILDGYDSKHNLDKFRFPYITDNLYTVYEYFSRKYVYTGDDRIGEELDPEFFRDFFHPEFLKDFLNHKSKGNNA